MKKTLLYIFAIIILFGLSGPLHNAHAQTETPEEVDTSYRLLQPLPCDDRTTIGNGFGPGCEDDMLKSVDPAETSAFVDYLNFGIRLFIGLCAVLGVVMFTVGGVEYATSELISGKAAGKERMLGAGFGIVLAFGSYTLLFQINPDLLRGDVRIEGVELTVEMVEKDIIIVRNGKVSAGNGGAVNPNSIGTTCDSRTIMSAAQSAGYTITEGQAATFSCLIGVESGCKSVTNYNWNRGSSAYGPFQILLQTHSECFENQVCYNAAGVTGPLRCSIGFRNGNPVPGSTTVQLCQKAADNFTCSVSAAVCLLRKNPNFGDWTGNKDSTAKHRQCVNRFNR